MGTRAKRWRLLGLGGGPHRPAWASARLDRWADDARALPARPALTPWQSGAVPQSPVSVLALRAESYNDLGGTEPENIRWGNIPDGYRSYERTIRIGQGQADWNAAASALLRWGVKTRSGFTVEPNPPPNGRVHLDDDFWLRLQIGPFSIREPVRIIAEVDQPNRCGFAYGTLVGHPVSGEEAFIAHRSSLIAPMTTPCGSPCARLPARARVHGGSRSRPL